MFPFASPLPSPSDIFLFALILCRMAGLFSALPVFGGKRLPNRIKVVAIFAITMVCMPVLKVAPPPTPPDALGIALMVLSELLIGITLSFITQIIFAAVELSGQLIGMQMGLTMSSLIDPNTGGGQAQIMSVMQSLLATLFFLSLNIHHTFIRAIIDSFNIIPLGGWRINDALIKFFVHATSDIFILGIRLAAPVMVALLLTTVVLGVMARAFPQMNVFMVSFPLNIGIGFLVLGMTLMIFFHILEVSFATVHRQIEIIFRLMAGR